MGVHGMKCAREVLRAAYREVIFLLLIQGFQRRKKKFRYLETLLKIPPYCWPTETQSDDCFYLLQFEQLPIIYEKSGQ